MTLASDSGYISSRHIDSAMNRIPHQDRIRSCDFVVTWRVHCSTDCLPYDPSPIVFGFVEYAHGRTRVISHNVTRTHVIDSDIHGGETIFLATTLILGRYARVTISPGDIYCTVLHSCTYIYESQRYRVNLQIMCHNRHCAAGYIMLHRLSIETVL